MQNAQVIDKIQKDGIPNIANFGKEERKVGTKPKRSESMEVKQSSFNHFLLNQRLSRMINPKQMRTLDCDALDLPQEVLQTVPAAEHYQKLQELEKNLNVFVKSKKLDIEEMIIEPTPKIKTMLLLHIYNIHYNQQNEYSIKDEEIKVPAWALRLQGRVLLPKGEDQNEIEAISPYMKMTHFINKIKVTFNKDQVYYPAIEWEKNTSKTLSYGSPPEEDKDGIEILREGDKELDLQIAIHINYSPKHFKIKPELQTIIGLKQGTRMQALSALWEYIKNNKLQNPENHQQILCNKELKTLFKEDSFDFSSISLRVQNWLEEVEPYKIRYQLNLSKDFHSSEKLFKVPVEIEEPNHLYFLLTNSSKDFVSQDNELLPEKSSTTKQLPKTEKKVKKYNQKIANYIEKIRHHLHCKNFFSSYSEQPVAFIQNLLLQQNTLIRLLSAAESTHPLSLSEQIEHPLFYQNKRKHAEKRISEFIGKQEEEDKKKEEPFRIFN